MTKNTKHSFILSKLLLFCLILIPVVTLAKKVKNLPFSQLSHSQLSILIPEFEANNAPIPEPLLNKIINLTKSKNFENNPRKIRVTAAILAVALGPFGVHRLYLGTSPIVPAVYVATVGGGVGILPFIDFIAILFTKDITPYLNNKQIFMWAN